MGGGIDERILDKAFRDGDRVGEIRIGAYGVEQEKLVAVERALLFGSRQATNSREHGNSHQIHERLPVAVGAVGCDRAELQGPECRRTQKFHGIENAEDRLRVLQSEIAVFETQQHAEGLIGGGDFDFFGGGKVSGTCVLRKKFRRPSCGNSSPTAEMNGGRRRR